MAYDEGLAEIMRGDLAEMDGVTEKKMFGGIAFMLNGNMLCGIHKDGAMYRVGKDLHDKARAIPGTGPMAFTGRPMGGMVDADADLLADDDRRAKLLAIALENVRAMDPK